MPPPCRSSRRRSWPRSGGCRGPCPHRSPSTASSPGCGAGSRPASTRPTTSAPRPLPAVTKRIEIVGPGDVAGVKASAILRTEPYADAVNVTPGELAYVEFYEEDFPWRYTPARAALPSEPAGGRFKLRPWIALFVLRAEEFTLVRRPDG